MSTIATKTASPDEAQVLTPTFNGVGKPPRHRTRIRNRAIHDGKVVRDTSWTVPPEFYEGAIANVAGALRLSRVVGLGQATNNANQLGVELMKLGYLDPEQRLEVEAMIRHSMEEVINAVIQDQRERVEGPSGLRLALKSLISLIVKRNEER